MVSGRAGRFPAQPGRAERLDPGVDDHVRGAGQLRGDLGQPERVGETDGQRADRVAAPGRRPQLVVEQLPVAPGVPGTTKRAPGPSW